MLGMRRITTWYFYWFMVCLIEESDIKQMEERLIDHRRRSCELEKFPRSSSLPGRAKSFGQSCNRMEKLPKATDNVLEDCDPDRIKANRLKYRLHEFCEDKAAVRPVFRCISLSGDHFLSLLSDFVILGSATSQARPRS